MQPAREKEVGFTTHHVTVSYSGTELSFQDPSFQDPARIELEGKDIVILTFLGISRGMTPGVTFSGDGDGFLGPLGPFQEALQTSDQIILRGNSGSRGTFQCTALLYSRLRGEEPPFSSSNQLRIDNEQSAWSAKEIRVLLHRRAGASALSVTVEPQRVALFAPDPVVWNFVFEEGLEPHHYEPVLYLYHDPASPPLPIGTGPFGPFQSLSVAGISEPLADGKTLVYRLITSGNNLVQHQYHFNVGVRSTVTGKRILTSLVEDPIIDNMGPPH